VWTGVIAVWQVLILATILGIASAFDIPMRQSFIVEMVGKDDLMNAIALNSSLFNAARVIARRSRTPDRRGRHRLVLLL